MPKKRTPTVSWSGGDYFVVPLPDGSMVLGQVLDVMMKNIVSVAFLGRRFRDPAEARLSVESRPPSQEDVFSSVSTWRDPLDEGEWTVVGHSEPILPQAKWPNEEYRSMRWVGAKHYNTALVQGFLGAFYALAPWDALFDPAFYDKLLLSPDKKPRELVYSKA